MHVYFSLLCEKRYTLEFLCRLNLRDMYDLPKIRYKNCQSLDLSYDLSDYTD